MPPRPNTDASSHHLQDTVRPAPATSRYIEAGGLRLHYLDYGTAGRPAMLCLHGGAAHAHWFDYIAANFSKDFHVCALDLRGHGDSAWAEPPAYSHEDHASDIAEVVEKLDLRDFILIGHSMGGRVGLVYAATYPGRVGKFIAVDSAPQTTAENLASMRKFGERPNSRYATLEELVARYRLQPGGTKAAPEIMRHLAKNGARQLSDGSWQHKFDRNVYVARKIVDGLACWSRIGIPALLIKGELSPRITPQLSADIKARCPHVEFAEVPHSNHHITLDNPSGFTRVVQAFLAKHP